MSLPVFTVSSSVHSFGTLWWEGCCCCRIVKNDNNHRYEALSFILQRVLDERLERWFKSAEFDWTPEAPPAHIEEEKDDEMAYSDSAEFDDTFGVSVTEEFNVKDEYTRYIAARRRKATLYFKRTMLQTDLVNDMMAALVEPEGDEMSPAEKRDIKLFTTVDEEAVQMDLMKKYGEGEKEVGEVVGRLQEILLMNYRPLRRIFKYYANTELVKKVEALTENKMSKAELSTLLTDCFAATDVNSYWQDSYGQGLTPEQFTWMLVKMSQKITLKLPNIPETSGATAPFEMDDLEPMERVKVFIERIVVPNANHISLATFKDALNKARMATLLVEFKPTLQKVFVYYASGKATNDTNLQSTKEVKELSYKEFKQLMTDTRTYDEVCTQYVLQLTFTKMQDDYDLGVSYQEFIEIIGAIAIYKKPAPYLPLEVKVKQFLLEKFLPPLVKKCQLRIDLLKDPFKARSAAINPPARVSTKRRRGTGRAVVVAAINKLTTKTNNASFRHANLGFASTVKGFKDRTSRVSQMEAADLSVVI
eukprot:TRINITY_DN12136_c0_g1_i1.p1 TRINITY_DN12136_c0_g1~~TRINITY_DN12136_c0_g1_i1.p1  ORF type:complete len:533 (+),score=107.81 TRINITY_DN12136_c0_g1_i1:142-1740(+)